MEIWIEAFVFFGLLFYVMKRKFDKFVELFKELPMDPVVPFFGQSLDYVFDSPSEVLSHGIKAVKRLGGTAVLIVGFTARVFITNPKDIEEILKDRKLIVKSDIYHFLDDWLGEGMLLSIGQKWTNRRKIITKSFHFEILDDFIDIFDRNSSVLIEQLKQFEGKAFDIFPKIGHFTLDVICETAMGVTISSQTNEDTEYVNSVKQIGEIVFSRFFNILLQNKWIFRLSSLFWKQKRCLKVLHSFTDSVIAARRRELLNKLNEFGDTGESTKRLALLDILLQSTINGQPLSDMDIREEVDTFMFAGHDTTTSAIGFCLYNLAKYPEIQRKAFDEIQRVIGDEANNLVNLSQLNELQYLTLVIKETMRLFPAVPFYGRQTQEDTKINGKFIPKGTNLMISPIIMGRMESIWTDPEAFIPERFLPENFNSSSFAFVPFSAGSRNCMGQKFAMLETKIAVSKILRNFEIALPSNYEIEFMADFVLRPTNGLMVELRQRKFID